MSLTTDIQKTTVVGLVTLYELDARVYDGGEIYRFHGHQGGVIRWRGNDYYPITIQADGLEARGDGRASNPTLTIANNLDGIQGAISKLCLQYGDFVGSTLTVVQTLEAYLADTNESNYKRQVWYVQQKTKEEFDVVAFELSNPVDFGNRMIPARQITSFCHHAMCNRYRGEECGYTGSRMFTKDGKPTDDPALDQCGGTVSDCELRFGRGNELNFGGFPASGLL